MRLLFASPFPYLPDNTSGREVSTHALALRLRDRGIAVAVFAEQPKAKRPSSAFIRDETLGYPVYRAAEPLLRFSQALDDWQPDLAILPFAGPAMALVALAIGAGVKAVLHATNVDPSHVGLNLIARPEIMLTACSPFTARRLDALHGEAVPVSLPLVEPEDYRVAAPGRTDGGDAVVLVNPTLLKGVEIFFRLAEARPDIPFIAVESWDISDDWRLILANRARALGNVALWPSTTDMRRAYERARLVLMPSIHEETYGRIVAEAQLSGIPALVSDRGALPETVGEGGLTVPIDAGIAAWTAALDRLWDKAAHPAFSAAARREAARTERRPEVIVDGLVALVEAFLASPNAG